MKIKRLATFIALLAVSFVGFNAFSNPSASAAQVIWSGGDGSNTSFSHGGNWIGGAAPTVNDEAVFPANAAHKTVTVSNTVVQLIEFTGNTGDCDNADYTFSGTRLDLGSNSGTGLFDSNTYAPGCEATITFGNSEVRLIGEVNLRNDLNSDTKVVFGNTSSQSLNLNGKLLNIFNSAEGEVTVKATLNGDSSSFIDIQEGLLTLENGLGFSGTVVAQGDATLRLTGLKNFALADFIRIKPEASLLLDPADFTEDIEAPLGLVLEPRARVEVPSNSTHTLILTREISINGNDPIEVYLAKANLTITGNLSGTGYFELRDDSIGTLKVDSDNNTTTNQPNKTFSTAPHTNTYNADQTSVNIIVGKNETAIVTGKYGGVTVNDGGILKGTGSVGILIVLSGGRVTPGQSPGCLSAGDTTFYAGSSLDIELAGKTVCTEYDQLKVVGTLALGNTALNISRLNDFKPATGDTFIVVDNDGTDAITGTFNNLAEGATFTADGYVYKVTYVGGDGNDVAITVQTVPSSPNTGMQLLTANPLLTLALTAASASALFFIAKRYSTVSKK